MKSYLVEWRIDIEADSPQEAAELARKYQRPGTSAVVFHVTDGDGTETVIDLEETTP